MPRYLGNLPSDMNVHSHFVDKTPQSPNIYSMCVSALDMVSTNRAKSQNIVPQGSKLHQHYYYSIEKNHCTSTRFMFLMQQLLQRL